MLKRDPDLPLKVHTAMCPDVGILKIFPGMTVAAVSIQTQLYTLLVLSAFSKLSVSLAGSLPTATNEGSCIADIWSRQCTFRAAAAPGAERGL